VRLITIVVMIAVAGVAGAARAEVWASDLGALLHDATSIEIVQVDKVKDFAIDGRVVEAIRSKALVGDASHRPLTHGMSSTSPGDRVLVICDRALCPRAEAIDRDGVFLLFADQPNDVAGVAPSVVVHDSLLALAAGKPAPDLCVAGTIELLDDRARPAFRVTISAARGDGHATIGTTQVPGYAQAGRASDLRVRLEPEAPRSRPANREVELAAVRVTRDAEGCLTGSFRVASPPARTAKGLARVLAGTQARSVLARGTLDLARGAALPAGHHALELAITDEGRLDLTTDLATGHVPRYEVSGDHLVVGFQRGPDGDARGPDYQALRTDLGTGPAATRPPPTWLRSSRARRPPCSRSRWSRR
jgi:hypothetical protein